MAGLSVGRRVEVKGHGQIGERRDGKRERDREEIGAGKKREKGEESGGEKERGRVDNEMKGKAVEGRRVGGGVSRHSSRVLV
jgi:hypothetical protein